MAGSAEYAGRAVAIVRIEEWDETGDWDVADQYRLDAAQRLSELKRTIQIIPDNLREEELFRIRDGHAIKQRDERRDLRTGAATQSLSNWFDAPRAITDPKQFPFWTLITGQPNQTRTAGEVCAPDSSK